MTASIPSGWYFCAASSDIKAGSTKSLFLFNEQLVLWRGHDNVAHLSSAKCPHLGSNLAKLGRVVGNNLECFSHKYTFNGTGDCVQTANKTLPCLTTKGVLRQFPLHEVAGFIIAWYSNKHEAPSWSIPDSIFSSKNQSAFVRSNFVFDVSLEILNEDNFDAGHLYSWHKVTDVVSSIPLVEGPQISITHDFKRHSILFSKPLPAYLGFLSKPVISQYGSTLYGHGLTYSFIHIFNLDLYMQDFIWCTPITATKTLYTTFLRREHPKHPLSLGKRLYHKFLIPFIFQACVWRLRQEHQHEGKGFWEHQSPVSSPILTAAEEKLIRPYRQWCRQFV